MLEYYYNLGSMAGKHRALSPLLTGLKVVDRYQVKDTRSALSDKRRYAAIPI